LDQWTHDIVFSIGKDSQVFGNVNHNKFLSQISSYSLETYDLSSDSKLSVNYKTIIRQLMVKVIIAMKVALRLKLRNFDAISWDRV